MSLKRRDTRRRLRNHEGTTESGPNIGLYDASWTFREYNCSTSVTFFSKSAVEGETTRMRVAYLLQDHGPYLRTQERRLRLSHLFTSYTCQAVRGHDSTTFQRHVFRDQASSVRNLAHLNFNNLQFCFRSHVRIAHILRGGYMRSRSLARLRLRGKYEILRSFWGRASSALARWFVA
jgi:hypothetical protein